MHGRAVGLQVGTLSNTNLTPGGGPFPLLPLPITGNHAIFSETYAMILTEGSDSDWFIPPPDEGLVAGNVHGGSHGNNSSQDVPAPEMAMAGFPSVPFAVPAPTCGLAGGFPCALQLDGSARCTKLHLRLHGHMHPQRETVQCPWMGCSDTLQWMNMPRHIQSIHLGIRFKCSSCDNVYTRLEGLARHAASLKCHGATRAGEKIV